VVELLSVTVLDVVEEASLLMTNDQVSVMGVVIAKSVKWFVVKDTYGCHQIFITVVVVWGYRVTQLSSE
jgi:hypothetical protein